MGYKYFLILGAVNAFLAVGLGAFGAHGLKARLSLDMLAVYQTAGNRGQTTISRILLD